MTKLHAALVRVIEGAVMVVAVPWVKRAWIVDTLGGVCLVIGVAMLSIPAAFIVAGVWLTLRAAGIERAKP